MWASDAMRFGSIKNVSWDRIPTDPVFFRKLRDRAMIDTQFFFVFFSGPFVRGSCGSDFLDR